MTPSSSSSATRLSALLLLAATFSIMAVFAIGPFYYLSTLNSEIDRKSPILTKLSKQASRLPELRRENKSLQAPNSKSTLLLDGATTGVAGANLQKFLLNLVKIHNGTASSFQVLPPAGEDRLVRISVTLNVRIETGGLKDMLLALETGKPLLFIDEFKITRDRQGSNNIQRGGAGPLSVTMRVSGYIAKTEAAS